MARVRLAGLFAFLLFSPAYTAPAAAEDASHASDISPDDIAFRRAEAARFAI